MFCEPVSRASEAQQPGQPGPRRKVDPAFELQDFKAAEKLREGRRERKEEGRSE